MRSGRILDRAPPAAEAERPFSECSERSSGSLEHTRNGYDYSGEFQEAFGRLRFRRPASPSRCSRGDRRRGHARCDPHARRISPPSRGAPVKKERLHPRFFRGDRRFPEHELSVASIPPLFRVISPHGSRMRDPEVRTLESRGTKARRRGSVIASSASPSLTEPS